VRTSGQSVGGGRYGTSGWAPEYTLAVLERMRTGLLAQPDVGLITDRLRRFGAPLDAGTVKRIKQYLFNSPGLGFTRENFEAWQRLSRGQGTVYDARFLVHEAAELAEFDRMGFDPNPASWGSMGRDPRTRWHRGFLTTSSSGEPSGAYIRAHGVALGREYEFMAGQVRRFAGADVLPEVMASVDASASGANARDYLRIGDNVLREHPSFPQWRARAEEPVPLDGAARARLGQAVYEGVADVSGSFRAERVRDGAAPTLRELIAIVKRVRM
jgi:hypothetical protein